MPYTHTTPAHTLLQIMRVLSFKSCHNCARHPCTMCRNANASLNTSGHNLKQSFITGPHLIGYAFLAFIAFALGASAAAFFIAFFAIVVVCCWTCKGRGRKCHSRLASLSQTRDSLYRGNGMPHTNKSLDET